MFFLSSTFWSYLQPESYLSVEWGRPITLLVGACVDVSSASRTLSPDLMKFNRSVGRRRQSSCVRDAIRCQVCRDARGFTRERR